MPIKLRSKPKSAQRKAAAKAPAKKAAAKKKAPAKKTAKKAAKKKAAPKAPATIVKDKNRSTIGEAIDKGMVKSSLPFLVWHPDNEQDMDKLHAKLNFEFPYGTRVSSKTAKDTQGTVVGYSLEPVDFAGFTCAGWAKYNSKGYVSLGLAIVWDRNVDSMYVSKDFPATVTKIKPTEDDPKVIQEYDEDKKPVLYPPADGIVAQAADLGKVEAGSEPITRDDVEKAREDIDRADSKWVVDGVVEGDTIAIKDDSDDGLGLTDEPEIFKVIGLPIKFDFDRARKLIKNLRHIVGLQVDHSARLQAAKIQQYQHEIVENYTALEWAHKEAKNNYDVWFAANVERALKEARREHRQLTELFKDGKGDKPFKCPDRAEIRDQITGSTRNRKYLSIVNKYHYLLKLFDRAGVKALERKGMLVMSLHRNAGKSLAALDAEMDEINDDPDNKFNLDEFDGELPEEEDNDATDEREPEAQGDAPEEGPQEEPSEEEDGEDLGDGAAEELARGEEEEGGEEEGEEEAPEEAGDDDEEQSGSDGDLGEGSISPGMIKLYPWLAEGSRKGTLEAKLHPEGKALAIYDTVEDKWYDLEGNDYVHKDPSKPFGESKKAQDFSFDDEDDDGDDEPDGGTDETEADPNPFEVGDFEDDDDSTGVQTAKPSTSDEKVGATKSQAYMDDFNFDDDDDDEDE